MFGLGPTEFIIVGIVAILLFGKNLPQVAAKFAKGYRELRRGLSDIQSKVDFTGEFNLDSPASTPKPRKTYSDYDDRDEISAPKFEPPPAPPEAMEKGATGAT